jgi:hypothetical protein
MNSAISKRAAKAHGIHLNPENMEIGCAAHVQHLIVQYVIHIIISPYTHLIQIYISRPWYGTIPRGARLI